MLEEGSQPKISRVIRTTSSSTAQPATGFSWGDYEDGEEVRRDTGAESDGDSGGGWSSVKTKKRTKPQGTATSAEV